MNTDELITECCWKVVRAGKRVSVWVIGGFPRVEAPDYIAPFGVQVGHYNATCETFDVKRLRKELLISMGEED